MNLVMEVTPLIEQHREELALNSRLFGGVFIETENGCIVVCGADNLDLKNIFKSAFVSDDYDELLDARVVVQGLLESQGIDVISSHDFEIAMESAD